MSNRDPFSQMWAEALALLDRADQMHRQFFQLRPAVKHAVWEPPVDILETPQEVFVIVALPGVTVENTHVTLNGRELVISATRALPGQQANATIRRLEIPHGHFERRIQLPAGLELRESRSANGCLYLTLRKRGV